MAQIISNLIKFNIFTKSRLKKPIKVWICALINSAKLLFSKSHAIKFDLHLYSTNSERIRNVRFSFFSDFDHRSTFYLYHMVNLNAAKVESTSFFSPCLVLSQPLWASFLHLSSRATSPTPRSQAAAPPAGRHGAGRRQTAGPGSGRERGSAAVLLR